MSESHKVFSPGTPIIFWSYDVDPAQHSKLDIEFTGAFYVMQPDTTLEAALRLKPNTKHVVVVGGVSPFDRHVVALANKVSTDTCLTHYPLARPAHFLPCAPRRPSSRTRAPAHVLDSAPPTPRPTANQAKVGCITFPVRIANPVNRHRGFYLPGKIRLHPLRAGLSEHSQ
jgi:hypothetical protein